MSNDTSFKLCGQKSNCIHPIGPLLPATSDYFHRAKGHKDGLNSYCKLCACKRARDWGVENSEYAKSRARSYHKRHRAERTIYEKGWKERNKEKSQETRRKWLVANKDRVSIIKRKYKHKRRAWEKRGSFSVDDVLQKEKQQQGRCYWCHAPLLAKYHIDHFIPLSRGGTNQANNIVLACPHCNLSRSDRLPSEWLPLVASRPDESD